MKVPIIQIKDLCIKALIKKGLEKPDAFIIASEFIENELKGKKTHALMTFPSFIEVDVSMGDWGIGSE